MGTSLLAPHTRPSIVTERTESSNAFISVSSSQGLTSRVTTDWETGLAEEDNAKKKDTDFGNCLGFVRLLGSICRDTLSLDAFGLLIHFVV